MQALIEKAVREQHNIFSQDDYINVIHDARPSNRFIVTKMGQHDFIDFQLLKKQCSVRKPEECSFLDAFYFKVSSAYPSGYEIAANYLSLHNGDVEKVNLLPVRI